MDIERQYDKAQFRTNSILSREAIGGLEGLGARNAHNMTQQVDRRESEADSNIFADLAGLGKSNPKLAKAAAGHATKAVKENPNMTAAALEHTKHQARNNPNMTQAVVRQG